MKDENLEENELEAVGFDKNDDLFLRVTLEGFKSNNVSEESVLKFFDNNNYWINVDLKEKKYYLSILISNVDFTTSHFIKSMEDISK